jgi:hypothetical protein
MRRGFHHDPVAVISSITAVRRNWFSGLRLGMIYALGLVSMNALITASMGGALRASGRHPRFHHAVAWTGAVYSCIHRGHFSVWDFRLSSSAGIAKAVCAAQCRKIGNDGARGLRVQQPGFSNPEAQKPVPSECDSPHRRDHCHGFLQPDLVQPC